jgi:putative transposase
MILAKKVRIIPNVEQEQKLWQSVGTARFIYNWTLVKQENNYKNGGKFINDGDLRKELTDESIGVDVGIKDLAICSNGMTFKNINKTKEVKRLKKKLKRKQKQVSRKYEKSKIQIRKEGENRYKFTKTNNIKKLEREIKLIQRRLSNIRLNHIHQATTAIVKTKPCRIVVEDLNVRGMLKNKHLSKAIQEQCFHKFISILGYKSKFNGIEFVKADRFYPSSKTCSYCGAIKKDLKLKDRVFICPSCNSRIDRDKNVSINLSRYKQSA